MQVLQGRGDNPRSTGGTSGDLELSGFDILSDGRGNGGLWSLPGVDVVGRGSSEAERVRGSGSCEDGESEKSTEKGGGVGICSTGKVIHFVVQDDAIGCHNG